ncbi:MAG: histidinol dehydrogenase [Planctomycetota bacterium]
MSRDSASGTVRADLLPLRDQDRILRERHNPVDRETLAAAAAIVDDVAARGDAAVRDHAVRLGDLVDDSPMIITRDQLHKTLSETEPEVRAILERSAERIRTFADLQRQSVNDFQVATEGGVAGQRVIPVETAGCYAPGGRYPLPSSVLMTAIAARSAGVQHVIVATPRPQPIMLAAAAVAGADEVLAVGGAQSIGAMAIGTEAVRRCDGIVGPGNRWVAAAKQYVSGRVAIDMIAGPSELLILADADAPAEIVAADLIAQAEHDVDAWPILVTTGEELVSQVRQALEDQLQDLPTADVARAALTQNGAALVVRDRQTAFRLANALSVEHVEVLMNSPEDALGCLHSYGGLFLGVQSAEVFGDYGAGPNHTLPTGGAARYASGLSIFHFLRMRTWLKISSEIGGDGAATGVLPTRVVQASDRHDDPRHQQPAQVESETRSAGSRMKNLISDVAAFARLEGLEGHARAAELRMQYC